jgi:5-methylcytosine-specific restriction endonuclease McrA
VKHWKGGTTALRKKLYFTLEYKNWRKSVFERDNYTCVGCKERGGKLTADHIKQWAYYPELRFDINNGRTLCIDCHRKTHTWGSWDYRKLGKKMVGKINNVLKRGMLDIIREDIFPKK